MIVGFLFMMSNIVLAETYDISEISKCKVVTDYSRDTSVEEMDTVLFGTHRVTYKETTTKQPMEWIVLEKDGSKALLLSKYTLPAREYNLIDEPVSWETCELRKHLNNEFYNTDFDDDEKQLILDTILDNSNLNYLRSADMVSCTNTIDKVFLLSFLEVKTYFGCYETTETSLKNKRTMSPVFKFYDNARAFSIRNKTKEGNWWLRGNSTNKTADEIWSDVY